jgi:hypothetical protein
MCVALRVLCVAEDADALAALKRATVSAEWELTSGATSEDEALAQLDRERPHVIVAFGPFETFVTRALAAYPSLRVLADREVPDATVVVVSSLEDVRASVLGRSRTSGA